MPFWTAATANVWRRTCGETGQLMGAWLATFFMIFWMVRGVMPRVSLSAKCTVGAALAIAHEAVTLPVDVVFFEIDELRHSQAGAKERPDEEFLPCVLASARQAVSFFGHQGFEFELVGDR
jgi:hypothetical protein